MDEKQMQHGMDWTTEDVSGWIATEKFNGCRAYWDGREMWSRGGIQVQLPQAWRDALPAGIALDGEIYDGPDGVFRCGAAIKYGRFSSSMRFMVFDRPDHGGRYSDRMASISGLERGPVVIIPRVTVSGMDDARQMLFGIVDRNGEGLVLRRDDALYSAGRSRFILKLKKHMVARNGYQFVA